MLRASATVRGQGLGTRGTSALSALGLPSLFSCKTEGRWYRRHVSSLFLSFLPCSLLESAMSGKYLRDDFTLPCPPGLKIPEEDGYTITPNTLKVQSQDCSCSWQDCPGRFGPRVTPCELAMRLWRTWVPSITPSLLAPSLYVRKVMAMVGLGRWSPEGKDSPGSCSGLEPVTNTVCVCLFPRPWCWWAASLSSGPFITC